MAEVKNKKNVASVAKTNQNKKIEMTPWEKEKYETLVLINEFKLAAEASAVAILYKNPELITETSLTLEDLTNNDWRVFYAIAYGVVVTEGKNSLTDIDIGFYLKKHLKLQKEYEKLGGYDTITNALSYVKTESLSGYVEEIKKWNAVRELVKFNFPVKDRLSEFVDMTTNEIYAELEGYLNHVFANAETQIKSYNALSGLHELVDSLDKGEQNGIPLTAELLNKEIGGLRKGHVYALIGGSGSGKSTVAFNYVLPEVLKLNERCCIFINEEDETKVRKELLLFCCTNILHKPIKKIQLRDGHFDEETLKTLHEAADWLEQQDKNHNITVIPLERYSVDIVIRLMKKMKNLFNVETFILDTMKESSDAKGDMWVNMLHDSIKLYDVAKPSGLNIRLLITLQTAKSSLKNRHLTLADIGQSKSIADILSCAILQRRAEPDEYKGGKRELKCFRIEGKSKIPFYLEEGNYYLIFFLAKNRFSQTDQYSIVSKIDFSTNSFKDIGYVIVPEDY